MKTCMRPSLSLCLLFCGLGSAFAQTASDGPMPPPKVLIIQREYVKPGKSGSVHEKSESAFVQAMVAAKAPTHYLAADSMSGRSRSLFFVGYDSFEAWEKDNQAVRNNTTLTGALDSAMIADGDLLTDYDQSAWVRRDDLSLRSGTVDIAHMRYFEMSRFVIRPGHRRDWDALVKLYMAGYEKASPTAHWVTFESVYGADNGGVYLAVTPLKSLAETDQSFAADEKFGAALSDADKKKLSELNALCIESSQTNLFEFNPKMSYPADAWVKADPDFWSKK
jgi:hypothetical protein